MRRRAAIAAAPLAVLAAVAAGVGLAAGLDRSPRREPRLSSLPVEARARDTRPPPAHASPRRPETTRGTPLPAILSVARDPRRPAPAPPAAARADEATGVRRAIVAGARTLDPGAWTDAAAWDRQVAALAGSLDTADAPALRDLAADPARPLAERIAAAEVLARLDGLGPLPRPAVLALRETIHSGAEDVSRLAPAAARALATFGDVTDLGHIAMLVDGSRGATGEEAALRGLAAAPPDEAVRVILPTLAAPPTPRAGALAAQAVADAARRGLRTGGGLSRELRARAVALLEPLARSPDLEVRVRALSALGELQGLE